MKKKSLIFILLSFFCLVVFGSGRINDVSNATTSSTLEFEISNAESGKILVKNESLSISNAYTSFQEVLEMVCLNSNANSEIYLIFSNFNIDKTNEIRLEFNKDRNFVLQGKISSTESSSGIILKSESNVNVSLNNLELDFPNVEKIISFETTGQSLNILENVDYSKSDEDGKPYLFEFCRENFVSISKDNKTQIKVLIPYYDLSVEEILKCESTSRGLVKLYAPDNAFFELKYDFSSNENIIVATTKIKFRFVLNGGQYDKIDVPYVVDDKTGDYIITYDYYTSIFEIYFNNQGNLVKDGSVFKGWFGMIEVSGEVYYFDTNMLAKFLSSKKDISKVSEYFVKDPNMIDNNYSISVYTDSDKTSVEKYLHMIFFAEMGLQPTYFAKWEYNDVTISFETNTDEEIDSITMKYKDILPEFETISKTGYSFDGWYLDKNFNETFTATTMPDKDITLYAKWILSIYKITFETNGGSEVLEQTYNFETPTIEPETPTKTGYDFNGWYLDKDFENEFTFGQTILSDIKLYANWKIKTFTFTILNNIDSFGVDYSNIEYNSKIPNIVASSKTGYNFKAWYTDETYSTEFDFNQNVLSDITIYAYYKPILYSIEFVTNNDEQVQKISQYYDTEIELPSNLKKTGYKFLGWFTDSNFENQFTSNKMPAEDVVLYANWQEKQTLNLNLKSQSYVEKEGYAHYVYSGELKGFKIYYLVGDNWENSPPQEVGVYNVRIVREEDENYKAVDIILESGFEISRQVTSVAWIIAFFYLATLAEIAVSIFVRIMRQKKLSSTFVLIGSTLIANSQFAHLIISGLFCLSGFVFMVYQIVQLRRTVNNENFAASKEDNRERFKEQLAFQNDKKNHELDFETKTKTDESFGDRYSESDIKGLLSKDTYREDINKTREKFGGLTDSNAEDDEYVYRDYESYNLEDNDDTSETENIMPEKHYSILKDIEDDDGNE